MSGLQFEYGKVDLVQLARDIAVHCDGSLKDMLIHWSNQNEFLILPEQFKSKVAELHRLLSQNLVTQSPEVISHVAELWQQSGTEVADT